MRVLYQIRRSIQRNPGGDAIQMLQTKHFLEKLGVHIDLSLDSKPNCSKYDIVHLFNITDIPETFVQCRNARQQGRPIVLSPIYWSMDEYRKVADLPAGMRNTMADRLSRVTNYLRSYFLEEDHPKAQYWRLDEYEMQREVLLLSNVVLPNSRAEADQIVKDFLVPHRNNFMIVPNAIDRRIMHEREAEPTIPARDYVLNVARVEERKNQLRLISALFAVRVPLVFIGAITNTPYARQCLTLGAKRGNTFFLGHIGHESLGYYYRRAKVHALPSWFETPGLSSLEAAVTGCNIVVSDRGSVREYFGHYAWYCDPADEGSIRKAVEDAFRAPKTKRLAGVILRRYTWEVAAHKTLTAYRIILRDKRQLLSGQPRQPCAC